MKLLYTGKAKELYALKDDETKVLIKHTDNATAGNGLKKAQFSEKGMLNLQISNMIFKYLENNGIKTHLIEQYDEVSQICHKCKLIPLEVIIRNYASGSMAKKMGLENGTPLSKVVFELSYKNDELQDPFINDDYAIALNLVTSEELKQIKKSTLLINDLLINLFKDCNINLIDFKIEFGHDKDGNILLIDEITPDCMRLWDCDTFEKLDKDKFRLDEGQLIDAYKEVVNRLKCIVA